MENNVGEILYSLREEKKVRQEKLCRGICMGSTLCKYERGESIPDRLVLNILMQRMGQSPDKLITALSSTEYEYLQWRKEVLTAVSGRDMNLLELKLKEEEKLFDKSRNRGRGSEKKTGQAAESKETNGTSQNKKTPMTPQNKETPSDKPPKYKVAATSKASGQAKVSEDNREQNENLRKQFRYWMEAILIEKKTGDLEKCINLLRDAINITMPGLTASGKIEDYLISIEEIQLILYLAEKLLEDRQSEEALHTLKKVLRYIEQNYEDIGIKVKIYPRAVKLLAPILIEKEQYLECMVYCKNAIELLGRAGILYDLAELMEDYLLCSEHGLTTPDAEKYRRQLKALKDLYAEYENPDCKAGDLMLYYSNQEIYLISEVIQRTRKAKMLSQEKLSEGICTPETLSRAENGRQSLNPRNFHAIMKKLESEQDYYNIDLDTTDYYLLEKRRELGKAVFQRNWDVASKLIEELKESLDMTKSLNYKTIKMEEDFVKYEAGRMGGDEYRKECEKLLGCYHNEWYEKKFWKQFLTRAKILLLVRIAMVYEDCDMIKDAILILENILEQLKASKVMLDDRFRTSLIVVANLTACYGKMGELSKCIELCEFGIKLCMENGRGNGIPVMLINKSEALVEIGIIEKVEACNKYFKQALYISDLLNVTFAKQYILREWCNQKEMYDLN